MWHTLVAYINWYVKKRALLINFPLRWAEFYLYKLLNRFGSDLFGLDSGPVRAEIEHCSLSLSRLNGVVSGYPFDKTFYANLISWSSMISIYGRTIGSRRGRRSSLLNFSTKIRHLIFDELPVKNSGDLAVVIAG